jgi:hypothetical protein
MLKLAEGARGATALEKMRETCLEQPDFKNEANILIGTYYAHVSQLDAVG